MVILLPAVAGSARQTVTPPAAAPQRLMTGADLGKLPSRPPDHRITYGTEASQYGELRVPTGAGPHPLVVLIHGGCFKAAYATAQYLGAMADALKASGIATERRVPAPR